ncbi:MAG: peptidylprolyl isomerase [Oscillospiraceae bacterium]|nr:peptidylprolyl isomerase [Oscillospiraceae bacterium]
MSASSKKKLRKELNAAKMTERQLAEQKEAKKLKLLTICFVAVLALILVVAITFTAVKYFTNPAVQAKNTVAVTIGDNELDNVELNYYFVDYAYEYANNYGAYASMFGLDFTKSLSSQIVNEETGATWADEFITSAIQNAKSVYAVCAEAEANGYSLSQETADQIDASMEDIKLSAQMQQMDADSFIQAYYGPGATLKSYKEYQKMRALSQEYIAHYTETLEYDEADLRAAEEGKDVEFNNYSYNYYYVNASKFLTGGTTDEEGNTTYSEVEQAAALAAAEEAAKALAEGEYASVEDFDAAIAAMEINAEAETPAKSTAFDNYAYKNVFTTVREWVTDSSRKAGDIDYVENISVTTNDDGTETQTVTGYYVVYFVDCEDNNFPLANVRHILVKPEGGTVDSNTGMTIYTEEELAAAKAEAEILLKKWQDGEATENSFADLATEYTEDPGSQETGGLYTDVYPGQMVDTFNDWCFAEGRKVGDTGLVETSYGYHIMYYSGHSEIIYRDYLIEGSLVNADTEAWYNALVEAMTVTEGDTKYILRDLVMSAG